ncbi:unnamed protein product [Soboliphyme baturini]|uniref:Uncharacterized protein n=1 Tax=Soboliphyme baturini TaxID=241478 RepID=A0A3P8C5T9_9BILA|nr:unnamed protein product [Soboliphyme baturini]
MLNGCSGIRRNSTASIERSLEFLACFGAKRCLPPAGVECVGGVRSGKMKRRILGGVDQRLGNVACVLQGLRINNVDQLKRWWCSLLSSDALPKPSRPPVTTLEVH